MPDSKRNLHKKTSLQSSKYFIRKIKILAFISFTSCLPVADVYANEYADVYQFIREEQFARALVTAEKSLTARPLDPQMRFIKGVIQTKLNHVADAISTFIKITKDYPDLPEPHNNLAVLYARQGQLDKARASLEIAVRTSPDYLTAYENLGDIHNQLAIHFYGKALQLDKYNINVQTKLKLANELNFLQKNNSRD